MTRASMLMLLAALTILFEISPAMTQVDELKREPASGLASVLDNINSLDFASQQNDTHQPTASPIQRLVRANETMRAPNEHTSPSSGARHSRRARSKSPFAATPSAGGGGQLNSIAGTIVNLLLGQLERVDFKRILSDLSRSSSLNLPRMAQYQQEKSSTRNAATLGNLASTLDQLIAGTSAPTLSVVNVNKQTINATENNHKQLDGSRNGKVNTSALVNETGNLISITKQLVKLARNQVMGTDYFGATGPAYYSPAPAGYTYSPALSSHWPSPLMSPASMLTAASHALHESLDNHHTGATLKSEWLWWLAPAVIVIGSGVILVPLIAAWLISQAISQNSFTVSAGRRRRRRRKRRSISGIEFIDQLDLTKLLDFHKLLVDDAPELLVEKLSRFHTALDHIGAQFLNPTLDAPENDNAPHSKMMRVKMGY